MTSVQNLWGAAAEAPPPLLLHQWATGFWISQALYVVAKLGVADELKGGARSGEDLAGSLGADADALSRVLRALAGIGVFSEGEDGCFSLTPIGTFLRSDLPGSLRDWVIMQGEDYHWRAWGHLVDSVRTGKPAFDHAYGMDSWQYLEQHPPAAETFDAAMVSTSGSVHAAVLACYDFSSISTLVDVGGGRGRLLAAILRANPNMRGVLYERPTVVEGARSLLEAEGFADRCKVIAGDFLKSVPSGGDAYIMKNIIHDWDDERAVTLLRNCHSAMKPDSNLLLVEAVVPSGEGPVFAKLLDLEMLVMTPGGRERTEAEYRKLFESAGFTLTRVVPTPLPISVIEGTRR